MKRKSSSSSSSSSGPEMPMSSLLPELESLPPIPTAVPPPPRSSPPDPFAEYPDADFRIIPSPDEEDKLLAERAKKRKEIRIREDPSKINTIEIKRYKDDTAERFLNSLGRSADHYVRPPPLQPPTAEQLKRFQARKAKMRAWPKKKFRDTKDAGFIPYDFWLLENFKEDALEYSRVMRCASLAIQDYNITENAKYRFVRIVNVGWVYAVGVMYFIVFDAKNSEGTATFEAKVIDRRLARKVGALSVVAVRGSLLTRDVSVAAPYAIL